MGFCISCTKCKIDVVLVKICRTCYTVKKGMEVKKLEFSPQNICFCILIDGVVRAHFTEMTCRASTLEPIVYRGSPSSAAHAAQRGTIRLRNGISTDSAFIAWAAGGNGQSPFASADVTIQIMHEENGTANATWTLKNTHVLHAYIAPHSDNASETKFESIEISHEDLLKL